MIPFLFPAILFVVFLTLAFGGNLVLKGIAIVIGLAAAIAGAILFGFGWYFILSMLGAAVLGFAFWLAPGLWKLIPAALFVAMLVWGYLSNGAKVATAWVERFPATATSEIKTATEPTVIPTSKVVDTSNSDGIVVRTQNADWPIENGMNKAVNVTAPKGQFLLINYGVEGRDPKAGAAGKEIPMCGAALVYPGETITLTFWDGNGENIEGGETAVVAYAQSVLAARMAKDTNCRGWVDPIGFTIAK